MSIGKLVSLLLIMVSGVFAQSDAQRDVLPLGFSLPQNCSDGQRFFVVTALGGGKVYRCSALNAWTAEGQSETRISISAVAGAGGIPTMTLVKEGPASTVLAMSGTDGTIGIALETATVGESTRIAVAGSAPCIAEGTITDLHYLIPGVIDPRHCMDSGQVSLLAIPSTTSVVGIAGGDAFDEQLVVVNAIEPLRHGAQIAAESMQGPILQSLEGAVIQAVQNSAIHQRALAMDATSGGSLSSGLGSELLSNWNFGTGDLSSWTAGSNWSYNAGAKHTAGGTTTLSQNVTVVSGTAYVIQLTQTGASAGWIAATLGVVAGQRLQYYFVPLGDTIVAGASGTVAFTLSCSGDYNGTLTAVSIKPITSYGAPMVSLTTATNTARNLTLGNNAGSSLYINGATNTGSYNTLLGDGAGAQLTLGYSNVAVGEAALGSGVINNSYIAIGAGAAGLVKGGNATVAIGTLAMGGSTESVSDGTAIGHYALFGSTGGANTCGGSGACQLITTGALTSAWGKGTLEYQTTSAGNSALGYQAGGLGTNPVTTTSYSTFLGANTGLGSATQRDHLTVIGADATGDCANCVVLGRATDVTKVGTVAFGSLPPVPAAGSLIYCTDCTTAAKCAGSGSGHLAVSNGTNWTCQ